MYAYNMFQCVFDKEKLLSLWCFDCSGQTSYIFWLVEVSVFGWVVPVVTWMILTSKSVFVCVLSLGRGDIAVFHNPWCFGLS